MAFHHARVRTGAPKGFTLSEFDTLGLAKPILAALAAAKLETPTPIQKQAIPLALEGHDILGLAQTGTGKTLAFGLPLNHHLRAMDGKPAPRTVRSLILAPTRELVNQIADNLKPFILKSSLRIVTVVGGQSINRQINALGKGTDILVATPGRLIDLMDRRAVDLRTVQFLVLDEADQMLDMGFIHALRRIEPALGKPRQTMLFSATMPKKMEELSKAYLHKPQRVQVSPPGKAADKVDQAVHFVEKPGKPALLREVLRDQMDGRTLVFSRTKHGAERMKKQLVADGFNAESILGNKSQGQRDRALQAFRDGRASILVATDVAARGIDIPEVSCVVNYDLPEVADNYVHRIGRTARAGRDGIAVSFCAADEFGLLKDIQKVMKRDIPVASGDAPAGQVEARKPKRPNRGSGQGKRPNNRRRPRRKAA